jgi:hypothetical protein
VQAVLYTVLARSVTTNSAGTILPKTFHSGLPPPANAEATRVLLYQNVFNRYTDVRHHLQSPLVETSSVALKERLLVLGPLAFEAMTFMDSGSGAISMQTNTAIVDEVCLDQILDQTISLQPDSKTYSIFADIIVSTTISAHQTSTETQLPPPTLRLTSSVNLLKKLINGMRQLPEYNEQQSARWIRCLIQIMIDGWSSSSIEGAENAASAKKYLTSLSKLVSHALDVATAESAYPSEELQWLATTLFNLAVDLHMASELMADSCSYSAVTVANVTMGRFWAAKAVDFADVLGRLDETDAGTLARVLREKCCRCGWDI